MCVFLSLSSCVYIYVRISFSVSLSLYVCVYLFSYLFSVFFLPLSFTSYVCVLYPSHPSPLLTLHPYSPLLTLTHPYSSLQLKSQRHIVSMMKQKGRITRCDTCECPIKGGQGPHLHLREHAVRRKRRRRRRSSRRRRSRKRRRRRDTDFLFYYIF